MTKATSGSKETSKAKPSPEPRPLSTENEIQSGEQNAAATFARELGLPSGQPDNSTMRAIRQAQLLQLQTTHGNAYVQRLIERMQPSSEPPGETAQRQAPNSQGEPAVEPGAPEGSRGPAGFIVEDDAEAVEPGQMRKNEFLDLLHTAVCATAEESLAGTGWTTAGCPYLHAWRNHYRTKDSAHIEQAIRRYAPETSAASSAREYIPHITAKVRRAVNTWAETGEITGVPVGFAAELPGGGAISAFLSGLSSIRQGLVDVAGQAVEGARSLVSGIAGLFTKSLPGGIRRPDSPELIQAQLGQGQAMDSGLRSRIGSAFGSTLPDVRLHTGVQAGRLAGEMNARAFTVGQHVAFGPGQFRPGSLVGDALIAHEMAHVMQQRDHLSTASPQAAPEQGSVLREIEQDADLSAMRALGNLWSEGRLELLGMAEIAMPQLRSGLGLRRCRDCSGGSTPGPGPAPAPPAPPTFEQYRTQFNNFWGNPPFNAQSTAFDPSIPSKGPRTPRSQAIFNHIYTNDAAMKNAYDNDAGGIRARIDTYVGPEGLNLIGSPRLQALEAAFRGYTAPVAAADYPAFKAAVTTAATPALSAAEQEAFNLSNEWQRMVNDYVTDPAKRAEIRAIIVPPIAPAPTPTPTPTGPLTPAQRLANFINDFQADILYWDGAGSQWWSSGATVRFWGGTQNMEVGASSSLANPGQVLFVRVTVKRGAAPISGPHIVPFPTNGDSMPAVATPVSAPSPVPATGDVLTVKVELLAGDRTTVHKTRTETVTVMPEATYTRAQAEAAGAADQAWLNSTAATGFLGIMTARGSRAKNVAETINKGRVPLVALTQRDDSSSYVTTQTGAPDPSKVGYFWGPNYSNSFVDVAGAVAFCDGTRLYVNRTTDVAGGARRDDTPAGIDELVTSTVHEAIHCLDMPRSATTDIESYKTEFRAYWMDGSYGPPDQGICPSGASNCYSTAYDPTMAPPGPKSPRARQIFNHMYGSATYPFVQPAYDNNTNHFREIVDNYLIPDGINLIASIRLDDLQALIDGWGGANFAAFRSSVRAFMGHGPTPANGALTANEKNEVRRNRAWRDLVERKVTDAAKQVQIKGDLGIPI